MASEAYLTTGSFENQTNCTHEDGPPQKKTRKRGIAAVLADTTNLAHPKRTAKDTAEVMLSVHTAMKSARGDSTKGNHSRWKEHSRGSISNNESEPVTTAPDPTEHNLAYMYKYMPMQFHTGEQCIQRYIERTVTFEVQKANALQVVSTAMTKWGESVTQATRRAADVTGFNYEVIRRWASSFFTNVALLNQPADDIEDDIIEHELSSQRGRCLNQASLINDEAFKLAAREFVHEHAYKKGVPNMTVDVFRAWVDSSYNHKISTEGARIWLHRLGFSQKHHKKGMYFDGHERSDVIEHRNNFVSMLSDLDDKTIKTDGFIPAVSSSEKPLIRIYHDESTFYSNSEQSSYWSDGDMQVLRQKSLGSSIMVSDYIDEVGGYLRHEDEEARVLLEIQRDGYWESDRFLAQAEKAIDIFEKKYPHAHALFLFDNAPSHRKSPPDALNASTMNVGPGGKQPKMRATVWNGQVQSMCLPTGVPKGMKLVLQERGVDTSTMVAQSMREKLQTYSDFANPITLIQELVERRGHLCYFIPKFHCELNPIERCWCHAKKHTRALANGSIVRLRKTVPEGLDSVSLEMVQKFFATARVFEACYRQGCTARNVDKEVKQYKSHRRVYNTDQ